MPWQVVAKSEIGTKHASSQDKCCQDFVRWTTLLDRRIVIGVVSDGAGSAKYSERGSECTVNVTIEELKNKSWRTVPSQAQVEETFHSLVEKVREELYKLATIEGCSFQDLACTLLAFIASPSWLMAMQIGDGFIVIREASSKEYRLLFVPDKGEYINETTFVTSPDVAERTRIIINSISSEFICAATDGIESISLIKKENWRPFPGFFEPLRNHVQSSKSSELKELELSKFLNSERLNQATDDDKTLILCTYGDTPKALKETNQMAIHSDSNRQRNSRRDNIKVDAFALDRETFQDILRPSKRYVPFLIKRLIGLTFILMLVSSAGLLLMSQLLPIQINQFLIKLLPSRNSQVSPEASQASSAQTQTPSGACSPVDLTPGKPVLLPLANHSPNAACYKFTGKQDQQLDLSLIGSGLSLELKDSNNKSFFTITQNRENRLNLQMPLNANNEYYMSISSINNEFNYKLNITLKPHFQK